MCVCLCFRLNISFTRDPLFIVVVVSKECNFNFSSLRGIDFGAKFKLFRMALIIYSDNVCFYFEILSIFLP